MKVRLEKGSGSIDFSIPERMIMDTLTGKEVPALSHEKIKNEIAKGIKASAPLDINSKKIAIIVPDNTRRWARGDIFVPVIVQTLQDLGVDTDCIQIIIALGTHAGFTDDEFASLVGDDCTKNIKILNSANRDYDRLEYLGKTTKKTELYITKEACEADHIIIFGGILHHLIAGFGGGRKYILPGIAGYDSIQQNHSLAILKNGRPHPFVKQAQLLQNPVNEDMEDAAAMFLKDKTCSCAAVAANGAGDIFHAEAGELNETFIHGCDRLNTACCEKISQKGDFALISAGGHRTDGQLYQSIKALFNAASAVREKGKILFVAEAKEGVGNKRFEKVLKAYKNNPQGVGEELVKEFDMPSYVAFRLIDLLERFDVTLVSSLSKQETLQSGFKYMDDMNRYIHKSLSGKGYIIPFAENILPVLDNL